MNKAKKNFGRETMTNRSDDDSPVQLSSEQAQIFLGIIKYLFSVNEKSAALKVMDLLAIKKEDAVRAFGWREPGDPK
jgi:hypothetical protein